MKKCLLAVLFFILLNAGFVFAKNKAPVGPEDFFSSSITVRGSLLTEIYFEMLQSIYLRQFPNEILNIYYKTEPNEMDIWIYFNSQVKNARINDIGNGFKRRLDLFLFQVCQCGSCVTINMHYRRDKSVSDEVIIK